MTIRLLDPPLHEFLPNSEDLAVELERARHERPRDVRRLERTLDRVHSLEETNPMLGTRGARLGIIAPEIYDVQVEAIVTAGRAVRERTGKTAADRDHAPARRLRAGGRDPARARRARDRGDGRRGPAAADRHDDRAAARVLHRRPDRAGGRLLLVRDQRPHPDRRSGLSRDDVESGFLTHYLEQRILDRSPFETIDKPGVGWLVRLGAWVGREAKPSLKLGICGEHGGDPDSIAFFHMAGLDYVSCSPYRVPIARVAAAQAAIRDA